ncbi:transmembrane protein 19 isoform X2 [Apis mellifera]|uniref:Transmembrane protein 19 n=1 Tax=Apis mellifera TaxID=7460 RepID=A0A7M7GWI2_APIME|nr:transmembrane protein 19 isoform X2 [Apis mellifera]|eukprot:XP_006564459.1 transmembrane protein 19 isoform X2 [Apis mellifera]
MVSLTNKENKKSHVLIPVLLSVCAIPISMLFWLINVIYSVFYSDTKNHLEEYLVISPWRWLIAVLFPIFMAFWSWKRKSLNISGAISGLFVGFILTLTSFAHVACLFSFFVTSTKATKFRSHEKKKLEAHFEENSQRSWVHVLCNGGMATQLALLYLLDVGCQERPIDFDKYYRSSWLSIGILGAIACSNGDTWASEIGSVIANKDPFLITTFKRVPRGTNGGISWAVVLQLATSQWPVIIIGGIGGFIGSVIDSVLGATLQYSGINEKGFIVEHPGKGVKHISGRQILDNHSVNLFSTVIIGLSLPGIAKLIL